MGKYGANRELALHATSGSWKELSTSGLIDTEDLDETHVTASACAHCRRVGSRTAITKSYSFFFGT